MCLMGRWGTPVPYPAAMTVAFGRPIEVPHTDRPSEQLVSCRAGQAQLDGGALQLLPLEASSVPGLRPSCVLCRSTLFMVTSQHAATGVPGALHLSDAGAV